MSQQSLPEDKLPEEVPLPERVRPQKFSELLGQKVWQENSALRQLVKKDAYHALIFWGPPGTGKTSLASLLAQESKRQFVSISAVSTGVKELRALIELSQQQQQAGQKAQLVFLDEVHRLNKSQQDVLLPALEMGWIKFIGATTENPSFEVNKAVLSRALVFRFERLAVDDLIKIIEEAARKCQYSISPAVSLALAQAGDGDARRTLHMLEALLAAAPEGQEVTADSLSMLGVDLVGRYDKAGEQHYDIISAFIKSMRATKPDAAVYYLARMVAAGEKPEFIARRMVIFASEDIGNANPTALLVATSCMQAVHMVGYPEARIILAQAAVYLASSPKSNRSYEAIEAALAEVQASGSLEVPLHLRNAVTELMKEFGYGKNYAYAHHEPQKAQQAAYLPDLIASKQFYFPSQIGTEAQIAANLARLQQSAAQNRGSAKP